MSKKLDLMTLATVLTVSIVFWVQSCDNSGAEKTTTKTEIPTKDTTAETLTVHKGEMFNRARDYMLNINGYHSYMSQLDSLRPQSNDSADINEIRLKYTLGGTMTRRVVADGIKMLDKSYAAIVSVMDKHNISISDKIVSNYEDFAVISDAESAEIIYCYKSDMAFVGVGRDLRDDMGQNFWAVRDSEAGFDILVNAIYAAIDESRRPSDTCHAIKSEINNIIAQTKRDLQANRHRIEHEYRDYYMLDEYGKKSMGMGNFALDYSALDDETVNGKYAITHRYTSIYNPNLDPEFFADTSAQYRLIKIDNNHWHVEKRTKNRKIQKTPVFSGRATVSRSVDVSPFLIGTKETNFEFEADSVSGGRVYFDEIIKTQMRKKDWTTTIPADAQHAIDSLTQEIKHKQELLNLAQAKLKEADSVAATVVQGKFANRNR